MRDEVGISRDRDYEFVAREFSDEEGNVDCEGKEKRTHTVLLGLQITLGQRPVR